MYNHEPDNYVCPFCLIVRGVEGDFPYTKQSDIVYQDDLLVAFVASHWWPNNKGHVIIAPNEHIENMYDLPDALGSAFFCLSKKIAFALKATYHCDAVSVRQHNEPAGDQDVWHYHFHVFPRYAGDRLYQDNELKQLSLPEERVKYAEKLREYLNAG